MQQFYPNIHPKDLINLYEVESRQYDEDAFRKDNPKFNLTEFKTKAASTPVVVAARLSKIDLSTYFTDRLTPFGVCKSLDLGEWNNCDHKSLLRQSSINIFSWSKRIQRTYGKRIPGSSVEHTWWDILITDVIVYGLMSVLAVLDFQIPCFRIERERELQRSRTARKSTFWGALVIDEIQLQVSLLLQTSAIQHMVEISKSSFIIDFNWYRLTTLS